MCALRRRCDVLRHHVWPHPPCQVLYLIYQSTYYVPSLHQHLFLLSLRCQPRLTTRDRLQPARTSKITPPPWKCAESGAKPLSQLGRAWLRRLESLWQKPAVRLFPPLNLLLTPRGVTTTAHVWDVQRRLQASVFVIMIVQVELGRGEGKCCAHEGERDAQEALSVTVAAPRL